MNDVNWGTHVRAAAQRRKSGVDNPFSVTRRGEGMGVKTMKVFGVWGSRLALGGWVMFLAVALLSGCDDEPDGAESVVEPGGGVSVGSAELRIGDSRAVVEAAFVPVVFRDMGTAGTLFQSPEHGISGMLVGDSSESVVGAISVDGAFVGETPEGVALGSPRADVVAAYGDGEREVFTSGSVYSSLGLTVWYEGDVVVRLEVREAAP